MLQINRGPFFDGYRKAFGDFTTAQSEGLLTVLRQFEADEALDEDDLCPVAYMLATIKHECADTWQPITEHGPRAYFDQYEPGTDKGRRLGNTESGDGYRFRGRGYVQITGRANYVRMGLAIEADLIGYPGAALIPTKAYAIMDTGMRGGMFTGKTLSDYCSGREPDYVGARRIINGTDQAVRIAGYATQFEAILIAATDNDPDEDERVTLTISTPLPSPIPLPPIYLPPTPPVPPPARLGFWRRVWGGA